MNGALQTWSVATPPTLFPPSLEISQPKRTPAPLCRLLVVPSLFLADNHVVVDIHGGAAQTLSRMGSLQPRPGLVSRMVLMFAKVV